MSSIRVRCVRCPAMLQAMLYDNQYHNAVKNAGPIDRCGKLRLARSPPQSPVEYCLRRVGTMALKVTATGT